LRGFDALFDGMSQVRPTGADVTSEDVTAVAFVMNTTSELDIFIGDGIRIAPNVYCQTPDGWKKNLDIGTSNQLWIHAIGHAKDRLTQICLSRAKATSDFGHVPNRLNGSLGTNGLT
jgi:hypothetical protein